MRLDLAKAFTKKAAEIALRHYRRTEGRRKGNQGIVTDADAEIEEFVKKRIRETFPSERILGEESGFSGGTAENLPAGDPVEAAPRGGLIAKLGGLPKKQTVKELFKDLPSAPPAGSAGSSGVLWAIDPIDGTSAFASSLPIWAISVGVVQDGRPEIGVMSLPGADELYWGDAQGVFMNGKRVHLREGTDRFDSESALMVPSNVHRKYTISFPGKTRSMGSLAAHMAFVAAGSADATLLGRPHLWDIAAGAAMILVQGGVVLTLSGAPCDWAPLIAGDRPPEPLIAGPEKTVRAILPHIKVVEKVDY
ncbi:hypothetical protein HY522_02460 [bacterium]|nr:hypothetical protein [bacterium]